MKEYRKQLNRIAKALDEIPFNKVYIEIETSNDKFTLEKEKEAAPIGFKVGDNS